MASLGTEVLEKGVCSWDLVLGMDVAAFLCAPLPPAQGSGDLQAEV